MLRGPAASDSHGAGGTGRSEPGGRGVGATRITPRPSSRAPGGHRGSGWHGGLGIPRHSVCGRLGRGWGHLPTAPLPVRGCAVRGWPTHPFPQEQPRLFWTRPWDLAFGHQDVGPHTALVGRPHSLFDGRQLRAHSQAALGRRGRWERLRLTLSCWKRRSPPGPARGHYKTSFILHELGGVPRGRQMEASVKNLCSAVSKTSISHGVPGHSAGRLLHAPVSHLKPESALPHPRQQGRGFAVTLGAGSIGPAPRAWLSTLLRLGTGSTPLAVTQGS